MSNHNTAFDPTQAGLSFLDSASGAVEPMLWSAVAIVVGIIIFWIIQHKHSVVIRPTGRGPVKPITDRAKIVVQDGAKYWKLLKRRDLIPFPPSDALVSLGKDKYYCEFAWTEEDGYVPLVYDVSTDNFEQKVLVESSGGKIQRDAFQPFTPQQRALLTNQLRRAEARRKKSWMETISQLATPMVLMVMFICILVFWEDIAQPAKEMSKINQNMLEQQERLLEQVSEISGQNARILNEVTDAQIKINQQIRDDNPPAESSGGGG